MEQFIVSARKYRPDNFESLVGQSNIAKTLKNAIISGKLAHAYLFCGPRGVGKTSTARIFAKSINCLNPSADMEPCGECESCLSFQEGRSFSIHELDAASNNSVEDIRNLTEMVRIPPAIGKYSVYIIDEVHMLSSAAFNAFLKTLEEPPAHAIFILATTEKHKILPTILSRCQTYDFNRISVHDISAAIQKIADKEGVKIEQDALYVLAEKADGAMRDALTLFDQMVAFCGKDVTYESVIRNLNVLDYQYYFKLTDMFLARDYSAPLVLFDEILSKGFDAMHFIAGLSNHFRNLLVSKQKSTNSLFALSPSLSERYKSQASNVDIAFIFKALSITTDCESKYKQSGNQRLLIEFSLMKLAFIQPKDKQTEQMPEQTVNKPISQAVNSSTNKIAASNVNTSNVITSNVAASSAATSKATASSATPAKKVATIAKPAAMPVASATENVKQKAVSEVPIAVNKKEKPKSVHRLPGVSIRAEHAEVLKKSQKKAVEMQKKELVEPVSQEQFKDAWTEFAKKEQGTRHSLAAAMLQYNYTFSQESFGVQFNVSNDAQKKWLEKNCKLSLVKFLREKLKNNKISIDIVVTKPVETKSNYHTPTQAAKILLEKNSELQNLQKDLNLDIS